MELEINAINSDFVFKHGAELCGAIPVPVLSPSSSRVLPAARCGCRLNGVDPEPGGDVLERLQSLLVRFVVVLHLADATKESTHARTHKSDKPEEFKS